VKLSVRVL